MTRSYDGRDNQVNTLFYTPLKGRTGLTTEQIRMYLKDAHTVRRAHAFRGSSNTSNSICPTTSGACGPNTKG